MSLVPNLKYKTSICNSWKEGNQCHKGQTCFFAHGENQLRTFEQNKKQIARKNIKIKQLSQKSNGSTNYKTIYCKFYQRGECKLGDHCTFIHQKKQKRKKSEHIPNNFSRDQTQVYQLSWHEYSDYCWMMSQNQKQFKFSINSFSTFSSPDSRSNQLNSQKNFNDQSQIDQKTKENIKNLSPKQTLMSN